MNLQNTFLYWSVSLVPPEQCMCSQFRMKNCKCYSCERDTGLHFQHLQVKIAKKNMNLLDEIKETILIYRFNSQQHY